MKQVSSVNIVLVLVCVIMTLVNPDAPGPAGGDSANTAIKVKAPKRILHFSDGVLEEYSTDEEDEVDNETEEQLVDPKTLTWGPWMWYKAWRAGSGTLAVVDTVGEFLASFFGITTPKYYFELEEYRNAQAKKKADAEAKKGWSEPSTHNVEMEDVATNQPKPVTATDIPV